MEKVDLLSIPISTGRYGEFVESIVYSAKSKTKGYTCVANVHMLVEAYNDQSFANVVRNASIITPDGKPLAWALRILYGIKQDRVAGMDLLPDLLAAATINKVPVFFYGGEEALLKDTIKFLSVNYPDLIVAGSYSPPFRNLSIEEEELGIDKINQSKAELVFVVLGCPKQEKWMAATRGKINAVAIGVGAALPVMVGRMKRAPRWMQDLGLEWLYRLGQEPKRLFRRYTITNSTFLYLLIKQYIKVKMFDKRMKAVFFFLFMENLL